MRKLNPFLSIKPNDSPHFHRFTELLKKEDDIYKVSNRILMGSPTKAMGPKKLQKTFFLILIMSILYTIIDFNEVDMRMYLPEKVMIQRGRQAEVNITFKG